MKLKALVLFGTRPEAIKLAPVIQEMKRRSDVFDCCVCFSGQHRDMGLSALANFGLKPDIELDTMRPGQNLNQLTSRLFDAIDPVIDRQQTNWIVVQGDTTSAMVGALAAFFRRVRVAHVEAGLRTYDRFSPFPEEVNRRIVGQVADLHFAPTELARNSLLKEGVSEETVHVTGNTVVDAVYWMKDRLPKCPPSTLGFVPGATERLVLVTCHRRESFGKPMESVCRAIKRLSTVHPDVRFILPVHPNPAVRSTISAVLEGQEGVTLLSPLDYPSLLWCIQNSELIMSDSGGIQEEVPAFQKPLLILRESTERSEVIDAGAGVLVGTDEDTIFSHASHLLADPDASTPFKQAINPFGDGNAASRIADCLLKFHR